MDRERETDRLCAEQKPCIEQCGENTNIEGKRERAKQRNKERERGGGDSTWELEGTGAFESQKSRSEA